MTFRILPVQRLLLLGTFVLCSVSHGGEIGLLGKEAVTLSPLSRLSVRMTPQALQVHILRGEVLFKPRHITDQPMVVTAGSARLSHIDAAVCVGVEGERTIIAVLDGAVELLVIRPNEEPESENEIPLRAGDRVELKRMHHILMFHFGGGNAMSLNECSDAHH